MAPELTLERALSRYADRIYRIALLNDPRPARAAQATATAFQSLDWTTVQLDDQLEGRLIAALPRPPRRQKGELAPLPPWFWRLSPATRVALGLRLQRGYSSEAIAGMLRRTPDEVRQELLDALGGNVPRPAGEECRRDHLLRLDDADERGHRLTCEHCRATAAHMAEREANLAVALEQATARLRLPWTTAEAIRAAVGGRSTGTPRVWQQPVVRAALLVLAVILVTAALIVPFPRASTTQLPAQPHTTARDILARAIAYYGAPPIGTGIVHQRFEINVGQPSRSITAEAWTDTTDASRHRMQLTTGNVLQEWQVGDGAGALRYLSNGSLQNCGRTYPGATARSDEINRWLMDAEDQAAMRASRWQFGAWAVGRHYMEQAQAAEHLRSLGVVVVDEHQVLTLAAEGRTISGTLLLKLDVDDLTLREVREVVDDGTTRASVPWRLASMEQLDPVAATQSGVLDRLPLEHRPDVYDRAMPLLDPACPLWDTEHAYSLVSTIEQGTTPVLGLDRVPSGIERIYLAGRRRVGEETDGERNFLRLIYLGAHKRLTLIVVPGLEGPMTTATIPPGSIAAGAWLVRFRAGSIAGMRGDARPAPKQLSPRQPSFWFVAEGWTESEVLDLLAGVRSLDQEDVSALGGLVYEPNTTQAAAGAASDQP